MTNEERLWMKWLSERLMEGKDYENFKELVKEIFALLERQESRLHQTAQPKSNWPDWLQEFAFGHPSFGGRHVELSPSSLPIPSDGLGGAVRVSFLFWGQKRF